MDTNGLEIYISNYKCFKDKTGFKQIKPVNLIIGKNNSGKSALLDLIERACNKNYSFLPHEFCSSAQPVLSFRTRLQESTLTRIFQSGTSGGAIPGSHRTYGMLLLGREIEWTKQGQGKLASVLIECDDHGLSPPIKSADQYADRLINTLPVWLESMSFTKVGAERDIVLEPASRTLTISPNGAGITNAIQAFLNQADLSTSKIQTEMKNALNEIFAPDTEFTDISCQIDSGNSWEIYLEEENKGSIALSKSGSGLKTIISILAALILIPAIEGKKLSQFVFAFEEPENNIHPALLRRLNEYLYKKGKEESFIYFLTTHSNVLIDQFSVNSDAQIIHVTQTSGAASAKVVETYVDNHGVLDDLDVRASDLLQSNGIIWVEGPTDRAYVNRWIDLYSEGDLKEGTHYQVVIYGGRLLYHLSGESPGDNFDGISLFQANRNSAILIDSDKRKAQSRLKPTAMRIKSEFEKMGSISWITKGREIENYIPGDAIEALIGQHPDTPLEQYDSFFDYIERLMPSDGSRYRAKKMLLAEQICPLLTLEMISPVLDLKTRLDDLCGAIRRWNGID